MKQLERVSRQIEELLAEAARIEEKTGPIASRFVEQEARTILRQHPNLNEFVMGMGHAFFTRKIGSRDSTGVVVTEDFDVIQEDDAPHYIKNSPLMRFIEEWDTDLCITGEPMRFTANGRVVRNW